MQNYQMQHYHESKKARRVASVLYLLFLGFIVGGTLLSQQEKRVDTAQEANAPVSKRANN